MLLGLPNEGRVWRGTQHAWGDQKCLRNFSLLENLKERPVGAPRRNYLKANKMEVDYIKLAQDSDQ